MIKGDTLIDPECTIVNAVLLYDNGGNPYSCSLTYTDIVANSNKFYVIQALHQTNVRAGGHFWVYIRYGRNGERGNTIDKIFLTKESAIAYFKKQYASKTGNSWGLFKDFKPKLNKYFRLDMANITIENDKKEVDSISNNTNDHNIPLESQSVDETLNPKVQAVITLISDTKIHIEAIRSFGVDTKKMPLGKISDLLINEANQILTDTLKIVETFDDGSWEESRIMLGLPQGYFDEMLLDWSNKFWTRIPYGCGRKAPPLINNIDQINQCADLLDVLKNSQIAGAITKRCNGLLDIYKSLNVKITPLTNENMNEVFLIKKFINNTHAPTHHFHIEIIDIFRLNKEHFDIHNIFDNTPNHMLLSHGSRMSNFMGILSTGFRIPKDNQVTNGCTLGRGIYFADVITKSFNYCNSRETDDEAFIIICEVALGNDESIQKCETMVAHNKMNLPPEYTSRQGVGAKTMHHSDYTLFETNDDFIKNAKIPQGPLIDRQGLGYFASFQYNEFVIFDTRLYRMRYLIRMKNVYT